MRRLSGFLVAGALVMLPALSHTRGGASAQQPQGAQPQAGAAAPAAAQPQKLTFDGQIALWSVAIKADKTADFEQVVAKLKESLAKAATPEAKQQAAGWKVMRGIKNPTTGDIIYTHVINPVVPGADYTVMRIIYEANQDPAERQRIYDLYRGAFSANLGANTGTIVGDLGAP